MQSRMRTSRLRELGGKNRGVFNTMLLVASLLLVVMELPVPQWGKIPIDLH